MMYQRSKFFVVILILLLQIPAGIVGQPIVNSRTTSIPVTEPPQLLPAIDPQNEMAESFSTLPLAFELNRGQADDSVQFIARGKGYNLLLKAEEAILAFASSENVKSQDAPQHVAKPRAR